MTILLSSASISLVSYLEVPTLLTLTPGLWQSIQREGDAVTALTGRLHPEGSVKSTKWKITWLPDLPDLVPLTLVDFAHLITKKKVEEEDIFEDLVNPVSVSPQASMNMQNTVYPNVAAADHLVARPAQPGASHPV